MDIDLLAKMIKEVMLQNDSVTLPGVGSFVAELVPASFSDKGYTLNPPYRRLYFIPRQGEDKLLAALYASSNGVSEQDAEQIITDFLHEMKEMLLSRRVMVFPGLGRLRATRENHIFFVADEDLDIYPAGYGLEPISLKTHVETEAQVEAAVASLAKAMEEVPEEPEPVEPEPMEPEPEPVATEPERRKFRIPSMLWKVLLGVLAVAAALLIALAVAGRVAPEWIDYYLYSPEELEIIYE
ncbi:MAG: hypothetical protein IJ627_02935 [Bacteroidales bacterium]|nr:hypothetical protein [Bacteroidales bacterium]